MNCELSIVNYRIIVQSNYNLLRWLLRRGSPLPIPNREVKPACADGTAVMWESMSSPFFMEPQSEKIGVLFFNGTTCSPPRRVGSSPFFENPSSIDEGFFVLDRRLHLKASYSYHASLVSFARVKCRFF